MAVRTTWTAGDVLTAADLTDTFGAKANLASPTFTGTPTAPTAAAGTNTTQVATTAFVQAASGLTLITTQSFSTASTVSVNNCFSATYDNYRLIVTIDTLSTAMYVMLRMRAAGSDNASSNYYFAGGAYANANSTIGDFKSASLVNFWQISNTSTTDDNFFIGDICGPNRTFLTTVNGTFTGVNATDMTHGFWGGRMSVTTAYDGFSLVTSTGTISGSLSVFGYRN